VIRINTIRSRIATISSTNTIKRRTIRARMRRNTIIRRATIRRIHTMKRINKNNYKKNTIAMRSQ